MWEEFVEKYEKIRAKNKDLPEMKHLNSEYEIKLYVSEKKEVPSFVLRNIRRGMTSYMMSWLNIFHGYVVPNQGSGISMEEMKHFGVDEKREIAKIIDKLMYVSRSNSLMEIERNQKKEVEWIIEINKMWLELKKEMKPKVVKNVSKWKEHFEK